MKLYTIGDLHLSFAVEKKMDLFPGWENYEAKLEKNWWRKIEEQDVVVIAGDVSWGMCFSESLRDFQFIDELPGKKIIVKGNHDYWWSSVKKIKDFWANFGLTSLSLLRNNAFLFGDVAICGGKGCLCGLGVTEDDRKLARREALRLEVSIRAGLEMEAKELLVFLHYPPLVGAGAGDGESEILDVLHKYAANITACYYGHLHGDAMNTAFTGTYDGILFRLISADKLNFDPLLVTTF